MELVVATPDNGQARKLNVSETTFGREYNESLIHQVIVSYQATARSGTKAQKSRSQVAGGGAKPWRQKGTGRARAGTNSSPIWRSGGVTFAATPRDHSQKINKKMYRAAIKSILSELVRQERLLVVDDISPSQPKTKELLGKLSKLNLQEVLIVTGDWDSNLYLAARNIPKVAIQQASNIDPVSLVRFNKVIFTEPAVRKIEEVLG